MQPRQPDDKELAKLYRWTLHTRWGALDDRDAAADLRDRLQRELDARETP